LLLQKKKKYSTSCTQLHNQQEAKEQSDVIHLRANLEMASLGIPWHVLPKQRTLKEISERRDSGSDSFHAFNHTQFQPEYYSKR
jgi:hypothetical protein